MFELASLSPPLHLQAQQQARPAIGICFESFACATVAPGLETSVGQETVSVTTDRLRFAIADPRQLLPLIASTGRAVDDRATHEGVGN
ncbi:hypothetical protein [Mesorhizobium sp.]|uniref:hypothetical protein n=1 Tax=Mesorhizobium sp. TaxID=1871066 RepID=UPI0012250541|nr:hypothetical protein [Mesorhizobium sp.]TIV55929.1 MAG: hypothetical protein E5V80_28965 [Mesorhizobium sp.]